MDVSSKILKSAPGTITKTFIKHPWKVSFGSIWFKCFEKKFLCRFTACQNTVRENNKWQSLIYKRNWHLNIFHENPCNMNDFTFNINETKCKICFCLQFFIVIHLHVKYLGFCWRLSKQSKMADIRMEM